MPRIKKFLSGIIVLSMIFTVTAVSFAVQVGVTDAQGNTPNLADLNYTLTHNGFELNGGYLELFGSHLKGIGVYFRKAGVGFVEMGTRSVDSSSFVKIDMTKLEVQEFTGELMVGNKQFNLQTSSFPNLQKSDKATVIKGQGQSITFNGSYLDSLNKNIGGITIHGKYGVGLSSTSLGLSTNDTTLTLNSPVNPGRLGYQNINFLRSTPSSANSPNMKVEYIYLNAFRIIENLGAGEITMFPNTGAKGDLLNIKADNFVSTRNYAVYFLTSLDGSDPPSEINKAQFVSLGIDINGPGTTEDQLIVKVPNHVDFKRRSYFVMVTDMQNNQIVAEQMVVKPGTTQPDEYVVIESGFKPSISSVYPEKGSDTGANVEIKANYVLSLNIPDLTTNGDFAAGFPQGADSDKTLNIQYSNGTYKGEAVTIERKISMQIGKKVTFAKLQNGDFNLEKGSPDRIMIVTDVINDAETDPKKDIVIEMTTTLSVIGNNKKYIFNQVVSKEDGYEFVPSTYTPTIDSVSPEKIQVEDTSGGFTRFKEETLISIKGDKFLVDRVVLPDGTVVTRKPIVVIKANDDSTSNRFYQLGFFPNDIQVGGSTYNNVILYKENEADLTPRILRDSNGDIVKAQITILNKKNEEVIGIADNQIGQNIIIKVPGIALIKDAGIKHIQVTNPRRKSALEGYSAIKSECLEFIKTTDTPVIESVKPNIITVEGGEDIVLTGANIAAGARLYLDGTEITSFQRELDPTGNKILLKFKAPKGREGTTQILVQNPSGGLAVADFTFVRSFDKNPRFDNFSPPMGTYDTIVLINGDNFLKPDPTAVTERGVDAFRLIGTRVIIDGREVNRYKKDSAGRIVFENYTVPNSEIAILKQAGKAVFSGFYENTDTKNAITGEVARLDLDQNGHPTIKTAQEEYSIKATATGYMAYKKDGSQAGNGTTTINFNAGTETTNVNISGGPSFNIVMNNNIFRKGMSLEGEEIVHLANYSDSVTLKSSSAERFTLSYNFKNEPILTNGKEKTYTLVIKKSGGSSIVVAKDRLGNERPITATSQGINLDGTALKIITPFEVDNQNGRITGNLSKVLSKTQILFTVPALNTGRGYKDLVVINPDTKFAAKTGNSGFYYISQATSKPVISDIRPKKGSVDGGYYVTIEGSDFEDDIKVYIDGKEVPKKDLYVALDGKSLNFKMPASYKKLNEDYGVDELAVPVVVVNPDGGSAGRSRGFKYIIPKSTPVINRIVPQEGSSNGGEIIEITGYEFRFYEPYTNLVGGPEYNQGDKFVDIYKNGKWDDLLGTHEAGAITTRPVHNNAFYQEYYVSDILPKVYFGENEAQIVEFARGFIKVLTPPHAPGNVEVYVINNDSGVSNKEKFIYKATNPQIDQILPDFGARGGQEPKEIFGSKMYPSTIKGYINDDETTIATIPDVNALVRFGDIDNTRIPRNEPNSGLINNQRTTVSLEGGLTAQFYGDINEFKLTLQENNKVFTRTFTYDNSEVYIPVGMLKDSTGKYYIPGGLEGEPTTDYKQPYEYVKIYIKDRRVMVERGYAPKAVYDSENHITVYTPSYYTIGKVKMTIFNNDGGSASKMFTYTNPASKPKIYRIEPQTLSFNKDRWLTESSVDGGIDIEIIGLDLRENLKVSIADKPTKIKEMVKKMIGGVEYTVVIVTVPAGKKEEIDIHYPIIVENEDHGLATSNNIEDLIGPNYGAETLPYYFVYKKPLSFPRIDTVTPKKTSVAGGNTLVITGSDFRAGAYVIIGTRAGIPIYNGVISEQGTKFTITTPQNMTLGKKDIQVLNNDYGTGLLKNAITVVSAPTVDPIITNEDGEPIDRIHVTGGQVIRITGTGFLPGAKVYFGGEYLPITPKTKNPPPESEQGIYRDDSLHYVKEGTLGTNVEVIDEKTLLVTTPKVDYEGDIRIVVLNKDQGISDDSAIIQYRVPIPSNPTGLKAIVVDNRYIKLYDYSSKTASYFEIYAYIGPKTGAQLIAGAFKDFRYLGTTDIEPYKILDLPGHDKMRTIDNIQFVVKAVNKFGQSGYSNIATIRFEQMKDVTTLGPPDLDGPIGPAPGQDFTLHLTPTLAQINLSSTPTKPILTIHLDPSPATRQISIPAPLIKGKPLIVGLSTPTSHIRFSPSIFSTPNFRRLDPYYTTYGNITEQIAPTAPTPRLRGSKQISPIHHLTFTTTTATTPHKLTNPNTSGRLDYSLHPNPTLTTNPARAQLYRYSPQTGTYQPIPTTYNPPTNSYTTPTTLPGYYVIMEPIY